MDLQLKDKIIVVTGGAKGIGEAIAKTLAKEGAVAVIVGRNEEDNLATVTDIMNEGGKAFQVVAELSDPQQCEMTIKEIIKQFGRIDGLVNNAGVNDGVGLEQGDYERFMKSLHSNLIHYYLMAHYALPELKKIKRVYCKYFFKDCRYRSGRNFSVCGLQWWT